jgi:hypothetical protein
VPEVHLDLDLASELSLDAVRDQLGFVQAFERDDVVWRGARADHVHPSELAFAQRFADLKVGQLPFARRCRTAVYVSISECVERWNQAYRDALESSSSSSAPDPTSSSGFAASSLSSPPSYFPISAPAVAFAGVGGVVDFVIVGRTVLAVVVCLSVLSRDTGFAALGRAVAPVAPFAALDRDTAGVLPFATLGRAVAGGLEGVLAGGVNLASIFETLVWLTLFWWPGLTGVGLLGPDAPVLRSNAENWRASD